MGNTGKRVLDVSLAGVGLLLSLPVMAVSAAAIWLEDGRPVIFRQERVGRDERPFRIYKLRTMTKDAARHGRGIRPGDARITRAGRVLRATSLDELPQLVNVLKGEMSLVGPRPTLPYQVEQYTARQRRRLEVLPGVTGWAQVNGRNELTWPERIELDIWYVDNRSVLLDLRILALTVRRVLSREGTYAPDGGTRLFDQGT